MEVLRRLLFMTQGCSVRCPQRKRQRRDVIFSPPEVRKICVNLCITFDGGFPRRANIRYEPAPSAVVSAVSADRHVIWQTPRTTALRTAHATAKRSLQLPARDPACLFQKQIHAIEVDDGMTDVQRVHPQNATDSGGALAQGETR